MASIASMLSIKRSRQRERHSIFEKRIRIGGHSHTYLDGSSGFVGHDGKGIEFSDSGFHHKKLFRWNAVHSRLSELIAFDRYLSEKERQVCPLMNRKKRSAVLSCARKQQHGKPCSLPPLPWTRSAKTRNTAIPLATKYSLAHKVIPYSDTTRIPLHYPTRNTPCCRRICRGTCSRRLRENPQNDYLIVENASNRRKRLNTRRGNPLCVCRRRYRPP